MALICEDMSEASLHQNQEDHTTGIDKIGGPVLLSWMEWRPELHFPGCVCIEVVHPSVAWCTVSQHYREGRWPRVALICRGTSAAVLHQNQEDHTTEIDEIGGPVLLSWMVRIPEPHYPGYVCIEVVHPSVA